MKIRRGFVSNSSSSSFICEISGEISSGWDMTLRETEMMECEKGHIFNDVYAACITEDLPDEVKARLVAENYISYEYGSDKPKEQKEKEYKENVINFLAKNDRDELIRRFDYDEDYNNDIMDGYEVPQEMCPICMFKEISLNDIKAFLYRKLNMSKEEVMEEIKSQFRNYEEFQKYLTEKE